MEEIHLLNENCSKCGSKNIDWGSNGGIGFGYKSHSQGLFSEPVKEFKANICLDCGYLELYINVEKLKGKLKK
jgi:predicted nucleic-acid-binding Zn-ribbon protein